MSDSKGDLKVASFAALGLPEPLLLALDAMSYEAPTQIQALTIPALLEGRDLVGQAQTGTGKTAAFALPLLARLDPELRAPQVLVLAPTRELAIQVAEAFEQHAAQLNHVQVLAVYGGAGYGGQLSGLRRGAQVVVGTPGRVMDHIERGSLQLGELKALVLDEADEMLHMGFLEDVEWVLERTPPERQVALFSATMPPAIRRIARHHLKEPEEVSIDDRTTAAETIRQRYLVVYGRDKLEALSRILEVEDSAGVLVFLRTKSATEELAERLVLRGYRCAALNGDMAQGQRERVVEAFRRGELDLLIATDVAARGLDVDRISHVINFDPPSDTEAYVHRIGRTGRAGRSGQAILFLAPRDRFMIKNISRVTRQPMEAMEIPSVEAVNKARIERFKGSITATLEAGGLGLYEKLISDYIEEGSHPPERVAAALARLVQGDRPMLLTEELRAPSPAPQPREAHRPGMVSSRAGRPAPSPGQGMERYRIEVGHQHAVKPGNIVGAIANEVGLDSRHIGRIDIYGEYSTVDLPTGMPQKVFLSLRNVWVCQQQLRISKLRSQASQGRTPPRAFKGAHRHR